MTFTKLLMTLVLLTTIDFHETHGYGKMIYPLSRNSVSRKNFPTDSNLKDGDTNCGGPIVQRNNNNKCGECGDDYSLNRPRPNENGGTYGKGMIIRVYRKNSVINVTVQLSGNNEGQFKFDICALTTKDQLETDECFHRNRLPLADGSGYIFNVTSSQTKLREIAVSLQLPHRLICRHCVLRWQFRGTENLEQDLPTMSNQSVTWEWRNCADIAILRGGSLSPPVVRRDVLKFICENYWNSETIITIEDETARSEMAFAKVLALALVAAINLQEIYGHGMMMDPVNRSSAWRKGFPVERNYNDNEHFCGGRGTQHIKNGGKCGECGDDWSLPRPRSNENGGRYGTGIIVQKYEAGETVTFTVRLAANHMGYFEFNICPLKHNKELETDECFEKYPVPLADGSGYKFYPPPGNGNLDIKVVLPNITCEHCVVRWHYRTGNTWGLCENGKGANGCGPQETFRSCADVSIFPKGGRPAGLDAPEVPADAPKNL
ncbi:PREDICTED: uncharacterized protein LOC106744955 [Dinoponera quadriceps]|uniref:Uncharacterized protein LOC106744955 n=1 Tax=Dinoponera quadriceps TaxID=609295 RepID=A0A6P3XBF6_DINQU|nr:PREDICTED: uncharacterized protein LOC106744955 [Dinoponera quadriceps]